MVKRLLLTALPALLPLVVEWVRYHERKILRFGVPLDEESRSDAARMGVMFPEKIRVMQVEQIPLLNGWIVRLISRAISTVSPDTVGLSLGYGIYIRSCLKDNRRLVAHECVHTGQYERYGGASKFLQAYLCECLEFGYPIAPLEQEAVRRSNEIRDDWG